MRGGWRNPPSPPFTPIQVLPIGRSPDLGMGGRPLKVWGPSETDSFFLYWGSEDGRNVLGKSWSRNLHTLEVSRKANGSAAGCDGRGAAAD